METEKIDVPKFDGFECIGVNNPCIGDFVIWHSFNLERCAAPGLPPQLCYRKIKPKRITFEFTGEVRQPLEGEYYRPHKCSREILEAGFDLDEKHEIYRIVEEQS